MVPYLRKRKNLELQGSFACKKYCNDFNCHKFKVSASQCFGIKVGNFRSCKILLQAF